MVLIDRFLSKINNYKYQNKFLPLHYEYFILCEFFTPALDDGLSLESKWQQVSLRV